MKTIVSARRMREIENYNFEILEKDSREIMERAGTQVAQYIFEKYSPMSVICVCGDGNNGGDGFVCASELSKRGCDVQIVFVGEKDNLSPDARFFFERVGHLICDKSLDDLNCIEHNITEQIRCDVAVDALFGIGLNRPITGDKLKGVELLNNIKAMGTKIVSIDIPSGVNADNGRIMGRGVSADDTVTFLSYKYGHIFGDGSLLGGQIKLYDAGLVFPAELEQRDSIIDKSDIKQLLPTRNSLGHKGNFGSIGIIGGAVGMEGATVLSGMASLRAGAGRVTLFAPQNCSFYDRRPLELMCSYYNDFSQIYDLLNGMDGIVFGPGAGRTQDVYDKLEQILNIEVPLILDADALFVLREMNPNITAHRTAPLIITPHLGEGARMLGCTSAEIKNGQLDYARELAIRYNCVTVLKGAVTVISDGENDYIYAGLNHGMATAGSGDVLSGIMSAFLAQSDALTAAMTGVLVHGEAGELAAQQKSKRGMVAGDIIDNLGKFFLESEGE